MPIKPNITRPIAIAFIAAVIITTAAPSLFAEVPAFSDYCARLQQEIQGRKHGFLAGNVSYYVGGFHASWKPVEHETLGLTHPFHHDLRSRGVGLVKSTAVGHLNTGTGNDYSGWEFYKDTRVLYGTVIIDGKEYRHPKPTKMYWRPDRMICEYELENITLQEEKFIALNDVVCTTITSTRPVVIRFEGHSFFGRHSQSSSASISFDDEQNAIHILEGGQTTCQPETNREHRLGPIMYENMNTVLSSSCDIGGSIQFDTDARGAKTYVFDITCDEKPVTLTWAMDDEFDHAIRRTLDVLASPDRAMTARTNQVNKLLNEQIPWFRCSDSRFEDIYYYLWSLYLLYFIDVQHGWETHPHTQTAVNNFLGMHRYDATFQIKAGAWTADKHRFAYGNVLTWKPLYQHGHYRRSSDGTIALSDNKGIAWHSGAYGLELAEHVRGAWQIFQHTSDIAFLRNCYEGYFREVFRENIPPFFSNHFEVAEILIEMAQITEHPEDIKRWQRLVDLSEDGKAHWFEQRWEVNGHRNFFAGPADQMLMTTGFWHMRSKYFPRKYAVQMVNTWATNRADGFFGEFFPLAMARKSMKEFDSNVDHSFGYTPDTAYFTLSGMFKQQLTKTASELTLNHLEHYNYHPNWQIPVAPEAYTRTGKLFGDQYSNFNAGKLLLILEGLAGLSYSMPDHQLLIRDAMPTTWNYMEIRFPVHLPDRKNAEWLNIVYRRNAVGSGVLKTITVTDCPLRLTINPWTEGRRIDSLIARPSPTSQKKRERDGVAAELTFESPPDVVTIELQLLSP